MALLLAFGHGDLHIVAAAKLRHLEGIAGHGNGAGLGEAGGVYDHGGDGVALAAVDGVIRQRYGHGLVSIRTGRCLDEHIRTGSKAHFVFLVRKFHVDGEILRGHGEGIEAVLFGNGHAIGSDLYVLSFGDGDVELHGLAGLHGGGYAADAACCAAAHGNGVGIAFKDGAHLQGEIIGCDLGAGGKHIFAVCILHKVQRDDLAILGGVGQLQAFKPEAALGRYGELQRIHGCRNGTEGGRTDGDVIDGFVIRLIGILHGHGHALLGSDLCIAGEHFGSGGSFGADHFPGAPWGKHPQ